MIKLTTGALALVLVTGLAGCGGDDDAPDAAPTSTAAATSAAPQGTTQAPATTKPAPAPGSLAAYALDADKVCNASFAASKPVDLDQQSLTQVLADRAASSALEVRTAQSLLALARPADAKAARVPAVLTAHRNAYAAVVAAVRADGRTAQARTNALVKAEPATKATSVAAGAVFLGLGSKRCAAWLNPSLLQDSEAR